MKLSSILAMLAISATTAFAQAEMGPHDKSWGIDKHRYSRGFLITRLSGENVSYKVTNISYRNMDTVIYDRIKRAVDNMEDDTAYQGYCRTVRQFAPGGVITLSAKRPSLEWGNHKNFTIVIKDSLDNRILQRETMSEKFPDYVSDGQGGLDYVVSDVMLVDKNVGETFYVYVLDTYGTTERYKFKIQRPIK